MSDARGHRLLIVICAAAIAACGPAAGQVTTTPSQEGGATVGPVATTPVERVAAPDGATLRGVGTDGGALVVAGADADGAALWTHDGAAGWRRGTLRRADAAPRIDAVAIDGDRGVAFGGDGTAAPSHLWVRGTGSAWRMVADDRSGITGRVNAVAVDDGRWLAAGDRVAAEGAEAYEGVVWASHDGSTFTPVATGLELAEGTVRDIAVGDETVVVVGFDVAGGHVWTARGDDRLEPATGPFGASTLDGVASTADGFVIVGRAMGDLQPRVWTSVDGRDWQTVEVDGAGVDPRDEIHDVTAFGGTVLAVGASPTGAVVWTFDGDRFTPGGP